MILSALPTKDEYHDIGTELLNLNQAGTLEDFTGLNRDIPVFCA